MSPKKRSDEHTHDSLLITSFRVVCELKIIACIKQVPDTAEVRIDRVTNTLIREGVPSIINPLDLNAVEEGLLLKERFGGTVTVISMGPPQVETALREALSLGADQAVLLCDRAFAGADTLATSYTLAAGIKNIGSFDLILCGKQAIDGDTAQVGPEIAEWLDIPHLTYVRSIDEVFPAGRRVPPSSASGRSPDAPVLRIPQAGRSPDAEEEECGAQGRGAAQTQITVTRQVEGGYERVCASLPALLTVVREVNEPRLPSYRASLRARTQGITIWGVADLSVDPERIGIAGSPTRVSRVFVPEYDRQGQFFAGSPEDQAKALVATLRSAGLA
jgi:electron transfer flavoprotein beta subunit